MEQRSYISEIILVAIVGVFVVSCLAVVNAVHRGLPQATTLVAAETPNPTATPLPVPTRQVLVTTTASTTATSVTPAKPTATAGPDLTKYQSVTGVQLSNQTTALLGKKVFITGTVFYVNPRGQNTWVQILTADNVYVDVNFAGQSDVQKSQQVKIYGTVAPKTTIQVSGIDYVQPYLDPGDIIQKG